MLPLVVITVLLNSQSFDTGPDIYEMTSELWERMTQFKELTILPELHQDSTAEDLAEMLYGYDYELKETTPGTTYVRAVLPPYLGILTTEVSFFLYEVDNGSDQVEFISPVEERHGTLVFDDSLVVEVPEGQSLTLVQRKEVDRFLHVLRTLALLPPISPKPPEENIPVTLFFHGRDVDSLRYNTIGHWIQFMRSLAYGNLVYAGPIAVENKHESFVIRFYVAITGPNDPGHHFFVIDILYEWDGETVELSWASAHFYPYVRIDNLLSLYGDYSRREGSQLFPIKILR